MSFGLIAVWKDEGDGHPEYVAQLKSVIIPRTNRRWGVGLVLGTGRDPGLSGIRSVGTNIYAYVPVTASFFGERLMLHTNIGSVYDHRRGDDNDHQWLTTANRAEVSLRKYFVVVGEIFDSAGS